MENSEVFGYFCFQFLYAQAKCQQSSKKIWPLHSLASSPPPSGSRYGLPRMCRLLEFSMT